MGCTSTIELHFSREKHARWAMHVAEEMIKLVCAPAALPWVQEAERCPSLSRRYLEYRQEAAAFNLMRSPDCALYWLRRARTTLVIERCADISRWDSVRDPEAFFPQLCFAYALRFPQVPFTGLYRHEMTVTGAILLLRMRYDGSVMRAQKLDGEWPMDEKDWSRALIDEYAVEDGVFVLQRTVDPMREVKEARAAAVEKGLDAIRHRCRPLLVGLGGSIAYGLDTPRSDVDIRGIFLNPPEEWIGLRTEQESFRLAEPDCVLYGLRKAMNLLLGCNPNVIELLGLRPEHILLCSDEGRMILESAPAFLSKKAIFTFGAFAVKRRREIQRKIDAGKPAEELAKEMMHLIRIYAMGIDLLENGRVTAYRKDEHRLLMRIRSGEYQERNGMPTQDYERLLESFMGSFNEAAIRTSLPTEPDWERVNALTMEIVRRSL